MNVLVLSGMLSGTVSFRIPETWFSMDLSLLVLLNMPYSERTPNMDSFLGVPSAGSVTRGNNAPFKLALLCIEERLHY
jgi:hypothetical protein